MGVTWTVYKYRWTGA